MMATLISTVRMGPALDDNGSEIPVHENFTGQNLTYDFPQAYRLQKRFILTLSLPSFPSAPVPFPYRLEPRSSHLMKILQESADSIPL